MSRYDPETVLSLTLGAEVSGKLVCLQQVSDNEYDLIYVNGTNNLENLMTRGDTWKARLIEEDFFRLMFEMEGV